MQEKSLDRQRTQARESQHMSHEQSFEVCPRWWESWVGCPNLMWEGRMVACSIWDFKEMPWHFEMDFEKNKNPFYYSKTSGVENIDSIWAWIIYNGMKSWRRFEDSEVFVWLQHWCKCEISLLILHELPKLWKACLKKENEILFYKQTLLPNRD